MSVPTDSCSTANGILTALLHLSILKGMPSHQGQMWQVSAMPAKEIGMSLIQESVLGTQHTAYERLRERRCCEPASSYCSVCRHISQFTRYPFRYQSGGSPALIGCAPRAGR